MDLVVGANSKGIGSLFSSLFVVNTGSKSTVFMASWSGFKDNVPSSRPSVGLDPSAYPASDRTGNGLMTSLKICLTNPPVTGQSRAWWYTKGQLYSVVSGYRPSSKMENADETGVDVEALRSA